MEIYILRHGIAENAGPGMRDADRSLTVEGVAKLGSVLRSARAAGVSPSMVLTSPYRRAKETAKLAAQTLGYRDPLFETDALAPESSPERVWDEIRARKDSAQLMIVGHEPLFGAVYAHLLGSASVMVEVKKGSLGRIDVERFGASPRGILRWLLTPRLASGG